MVLSKYVIDTDCLNFLLKIRIGRKVLHNCEILLPPSISEELNQKQRNMLNSYNLKIIDLDKEDKNYTANLIYKLNGKKEYKKWYLEGSHLRKIHNIGECEGAALARKMNIDLVLLDRKAGSVIKKAFKFLEIRPLKLADFGIMILGEFGANNEINEFKHELKKLHIFL